MSRRWQVALTLGLAGMVIAAGGTRAQFDQYARQRYEKHTKGTNLDDFVKRLGSTNADERLQAVRSLGESNDTEAIAYLLEAVGDPDVRVRAKAIDMLGRMRAVEATPVLIQHLFLRATNPRIKALILAALGKIGDTRAARPIVDFLRRDLDDETCGCAIFALGEIGSPEAEESLRRFAAAKESPTLSRLAREALAKVRRRQAILSAQAKEPEATFLRPDKPPLPQ